MKPAKIFQQYIWIVNSLRQYKRLTLEELNRLWVGNEVIGGSPLTRASFYRHKDAILNMFGVIIDCEPKTYKYYISNPDVLDDDTIERWMLSTLTVNTALSDSASLNDRILLENVPAGEQYLQTIIQAIKTSHRLRIGYQKFGTEGYVKIVCPYALKLFHQRWYLLAKTETDQMRIYSLDRMTQMELTDEDFEMPDDFSSEAYFADYYGVLTDATPMAHVVVRAYNFTPNYLRTLPLHASQREVVTTPDYTDFALDIRPTADFINTLLSHADGLEVLEPADLRQRMKEMIAKTLKRY